ncbi:histidine phosphotransferase family protein [Mariluticola halotolerans]|uniref:histidine phosphotransferase family protein n=1 Tax=Mariluticola halotolerans TaxID=2909283 RepID=UPI0026E28DCF|nr:histidine phosphotransferase family protein [Mariluticola halotolerans]UJQ94088.1 histidine phosphotransferase family protein [Mariluticola halotolerans]
MADLIELEANDLAAMLCSRVCHDLINPVGAVNNGLQTLADPAQASMADFAREMVANAAQQAQAKLEYARLAFGASSMAGTEFDTRECERVGQILFAIEKADLEWTLPPMFLPKNKAKMLMNMLLIASGAVPRGGKIVASISGEPGQETLTLVATSDPEKKQKTLMPMGVEEMLAGNPEEGVDARGIQHFYTGLLARMNKMDLSIKLEDSVLTFTASPKADEKA